MGRVCVAQNTPPPVPPRPQTPPPDRPLLPRRSQVGYRAVTRSPARRPFLFLGQNCSVRRLWCRLPRVTGPRPGVKPRERVLDAAQELFHAQGVDAVGVDTISERSGVSKSTLYRHFPSKAELVAAYLQRHHERRHPGVGRRARARPSRRLGTACWACSTGSRSGSPSREFRGCRFINTRTQLPDPDASGATRSRSSTRRRSGCCSPRSRARAGRRTRPRSATS